MTNIAIEHCIKWPFVVDLPSGKRLHNYGKIGKIHHFLVGKTHYFSMAIFTGYVSHYQRVATTLGLLRVFPGGSWISNETAWTGPIGWIHRSFWILEALRRQVKVSDDQYEASFFWKIKDGTWKSATKGGLWWNIHQWRMFHFQVLITRGIQRIYIYIYDIHIYDIIMCIYIYTYDMYIYIYVYTYISYIYIYTYHIYIYIYYIYIIISYIYITSYVYMYI